MTTGEWHWLFLAGALALGVVVALGLRPLAHALAQLLARRTRFTWDEQLVVEFSRPLRALVGLSVFTAIGRSLELSAPVRTGLDQVIRVAAVAVFAWIGIRGIAFGANLLIARASSQGADPSARSRLTHIAVMRRLAGALVVVVASAVVLLQFEGFRALGTSMLASAGVAGIVIGIAAQRSIAMLLAGLQISFTQPLRVGDEVVIEGEWGTIEEVTLTYVVLKIWDQRRLVVPITKILDSAFQNWTRSGTDILGTVFVYADYRLPVDVVRKELERFVASRPEWDGKVVGLQVTDATDRAIQLRAIVSSFDASQCWNLRCAVREHLIAFLHALDDGAYLPVARLAPGHRLAMAAGTRLRQG